MTDTNLLTVDEFGKFAPEVDTSKFDDPTISGIIAQASKAVSDYLQYTPLAEAIVDELANGIITTDGDLLIFPQKVPVQSVVSISITKGATTIDLGLSAGDENRFNIDFLKRNIRYPYQELTITGNVIFSNFMQLRGTQFYTKISYRGGWEENELPRTIEQATILFAKDTFSTQFNQMGASSLRQGAVSFTFGDPRSGESKFVKEAQRLLNPYRRIK